MGTWGAGILDDDSAMDFVGELGRLTTAPILNRWRMFRLIKKKLDGFLNAPESKPPDSWIEQEAIAAALIAVDIADGTPTPHVERSDAIVRILHDHERIPELLAMSLQVCKGVQSESSELSQLWTDADPQSCADWRKSIDELRVRLERLTNSS